MPILLTTPLVNYKLYNTNIFENISKKQASSLYELFMKINLELRLAIYSHEQVQKLNTESDTRADTSGDTSTGTTGDTMDSKDIFKDSYQDLSNLLTGDEVQKIINFKKYIDFKNLFSILSKLDDESQKNIKGKLHNVEVINLINNYDGDIQQFINFKSGSGRTLNRHLFSYKFACFFLNNSKTGINFHPDTGFANSPITIKSIIPYLQVNLSKKDLLYLINHCDFSLDDVLNTKYVDYHDLQKQLSRNKKNINKNKSLYFSKAIAKELIRIIENDYLSYTTGRKRVNEIAAYMLWQYNNNIIPKTCIKWINMSDISKKMLQKCQYKDTGLNKKTKDSKDKKTKDSKDKKTTTSTKDSIKKGKKSITGNRIKK